MTFLYDINVLKEFERVLAPKTAQAAPPINPKQIQNTALQLLNNLRKSYNRIQVEGNGQLMPNNLSTLGALVEWLLTSKAKYDGHQIVYNSALDIQNSDDKSIGYSKLNPEQQNSSRGDGPYVWRDGISAFLQDLQKQASDSGNKLFSEHISNLISEANANPAIQTNLSEEAPADQGKEDAQPEQNAQQRKEQPQQGGQQNNQQGAQNISMQVEQVLQKTTGSPKFDMPFDESGQVDVQGISNMLIGLRGVMYDVLPIQKELQRVFVQLQNQMASVSQQITKMYGIAPQAVRFKIDSNTISNMNAFVSLNAGNDYNKARDMMTVLAPILTGVGEVLGTVSTSPSLVAVVGQEVLSEQYSSIQTTLTWIKAFSDALDNAIRSGAGKK